MKKKDLSILEKVKLFFINLLYLDYVYILANIKMFDNEKYMKKQIIEMVLENISFGIIGIDKMRYDLFRENKIYLLPVLSVFFSCTSFSLVIN